MKYMVKNKTLALLSALSIMACSNKPIAETDSKRLIFDHESMIVITTVINPKLETMAVLYGNKRAYQAALLENDVHNPGEEYIYVTWKYIENPRWFGSNISKDLVSVERIRVKQDEEREYLVFDYRIEKGNPLPVNGVQLNKKARMDYIFEYRPSVLP
ncbi:hypothetical protein ACFSKN_04945 [Mariniflexile gromovii]|uniref:Uncharacterized protein n=1 Tax=Mariniflexile gromovii TaxID=362523 RepID=A0ABS4BNN7_9FLAO|nr:hypothetical protein [Mariniflexile gromovii]MBP0902222.1 hypothetical protein [Mariniflexile gromovii]